MQGELSGILEIVFRTYFLGLLFTLYYRVNLFDWQSLLGQ